MVLMQGLLSSETHKADEAKQAYCSALVQNEELSKKLEEAGRKIDQLQDSVQRFVFICKSEIMMHLFLHVRLLSFFIQIFSPC